MPRRPIQHGRKRARQVSVSVTDSQYAAILLIAERDGDGIATWMRKVVTRELQRIATGVAAQ